MAGLGTTKKGIKAALTMEAIEMVGKSTTMTTAEMSHEKRTQLGLALERVSHGGTRDKSQAAMDSLRHTYGLAIANGAERGNQALETVRQDAQVDRGYAIAKGIVNVPAQMVRGMTVDTAKDVAQIAVDKTRIDSLPHLPEIGKGLKSLTKEKLNQPTHGQ